MGGDPAHIKNKPGPPPVARDERGMPYLAADLDPLTTRELEQIGSKKVEKKLRELHNGKLKSDTISY
jgi:hypothetical protein